MMPTSDIERVLTVYRGIASKDKPLATRFLHPTRYRQHNPHAPDGVAGVEAWIDSQPKGELTTIRAFQDGPYVFSHTIGDERRPFVFLDIFHFEDGLAIEHWVVWTDLAPPNASGHSQTDGPTQAAEGQNTEASKALVRNLYETVLVPRALGGLPRFVAPGRFVEHDPDSHDGAAAFARRLGDDEGNRTIRIETVRFVLGQGDFVIVAAKGRLGDAPNVFFDLYRVQDGGLAEHWGVAQPVPPRVEWKNDNGML